MKWIVRGVMFLRLAWSAWKSRKETKRRLQQEVNDAWKRIENETTPNEHPPKKPPDAA